MKFWSTGTDGPLNFLKFWSTRTNGPFDLSPHVHTGTLPLNFGLVKNAKLPTLLQLEIAAIEQQSTFDKVYLYAGALMLCRYVDILVLVFVAGFVRSRTNELYVHLTLG